MAIREVIQKMADYGADGITDAELEEVKQFAKLYPSAKASLSKMLDYGADGVSDDEFKNVDTWSRPKFMEAKQKANSYIDPLDAAAEKERQGGVLSTLGGAAKDAGISLAVQGSAGIAGQIGTLIGNDPLNATVGSLQRTYLPEGLPQKLPLGLLNPFTATTTGLKAAGSLLPEGLQDALLVNPDNWLTRGARKVSQSAQESKTALQKQAERDAQAENKAAESGSIGDQVSTALSPSHWQSISTMALQSAPQLLVGGLAGRGARALLGASEYAVGKVAAATGSSMQAADSWQNTYYNLLDHPEQIEETPEYQKLIATGLSKDVALRKVARNHADDAMAMAGAASVLTTMLPGANAIEQRLAGVASNPGSKAVAARIGAAGVSLGGEAIQEGSEEASAQMASNLSERSITGADPMDGVVSAGTLGSVLGVAFSGPVAAGKLVPGKAEADPATPAPLAGPVPTAQVPAVSAPPIPQTQTAISSANMTAKQKGVEQDFETLAQNPVLAPHIDEWRKQNPNGEANHFKDWIDSQPKIQAAQAVSQHPEVIQASQEAATAEEKAQVAQQVQTADPTQGPLPGLTVEEMQDVQQNGTAKLEEKAKAAREQARTVAQTKAKEMEAESSQADAVKTAFEDLKKAQKERKTQAKEAFSAKLKAMQDGAVEWDEKAIKDHAEDAGISPEAVTAKIASARARYAKMKAAERASGKKAPKPKPAAKLEAEFTPSPVQGEQETGPVSPTLSSDVEAFVNEAVKIYTEQGMEAASSFTRESVKDPVQGKARAAALAEVKQRIIAQGLPFEKGWTPQNQTNEAPNGSQAEVGAGEVQAPGSSQSTAMDQPSGEELSGGTGSSTQERVDGPVLDLASPEPGNGSGVDGGVDGRVDGERTSPDGVDAAVVESARVEHSSPAADGGNFNATDENLQVEKAGSVAQFNAHMAAIRLVKKLLAENRKATPEEKLVLGKWNGWGPLSKWAFTQGKNASEADIARHNALKAELTKEEMAAVERATRNAHYTSPEVVDAMWSVARKLGFKGGVVLEPAMGSGIFFGRMPRDLMDASSLRGVELEPFTAAIAAKLYDVADIQNMGFEKYRIPPNSVSLSITNVPFGAMAVTDVRENHGTEYVHNFFIKKIIDKLAPGGIAILITGKGTMDANVRAAGGPDFRAGLDGDARFLGAVRLPETAFKGSASTKVVTDVLVFQKRAEGESTESAAWKERKSFTGEDIDGNSVEMAINEYYLDNPTHVLGRVVPGSLYGEATQAAETTVMDTGRDVPKELERILSALPVNRSVDAIATRTQILEDSALKVSEEVPPKSILVKDGKIFMVTEKGRAEPYEMSPAQAGIMKAAMPVRDALNALTTAQLTRAENVETLREALNQAYDEFVKKHGSIHKNKRTVDNDQAYSARLKSLEVKAEDGSWKKAPIFTENTQKKAVAGKPQTAHDALSLSLDRNGRVDLDFMSQESGIPVDELRSALEGRLFEDPETGGLLLDEQYLCGDIAGKMALAKAKGMDANVEALRSVAPEEIQAEDVTIHFGQTWIEDEVHNRFLRSIGANVKVSYNKSLGKWSIEKTGRGSDSFQFSGEGFDAANLVDWVLNGKPPMVMFKSFDGSESLDRGKTAVAQLMVQAFRRSFSEWMIDTPEKANWVKEIYNKIVNVWVPPKANGLHMTFPGLNPNMKLRDSQKNAIWRGVSSDFPVYLHHEVGAGKTAIFAATAMELRRTGKANKPVYVIPKSLTPGAEEELRKFYPGGKFLVLTEDMVAGKKRGEALAQAATGDWDIVVIAHSTCKLIPLSPKTLSAKLKQEMEYLEEILVEQEKSRDKQSVRTQKELRTKIDKMQADLEEMAEKAKKDPGPFWDEMGFDALMVDEAHFFKNLFTPTTRKMAGISTGDSQIAFDMFMKTQHMNEITGGKHIIFGSGTPVTRSMVELHIWLRYMTPGVLRKMGVYGLDAFIAMFGKEHVSAVEKVSGTIKVDTQLTDFVNVRPLANAWAMIADRATATSAGIVRPKVVGGAPQVRNIDENHVVDAMMAQIINEIVAVENRTSDANILELMTRARKVGIDPRLLDPRAPDLPGSKINIAVADVFEKWEESKDQKGTQIIWLDMGVPKGNVKAKAKPQANEDLEENADEDEEAVGPINLYQDMKDKLVARGVPADEIQFIHDHDDKVKKPILSNKFNNGEVRILIASRRKAGTGMNIQKRIYWMHHIDAQWNPAEMEQANGRAIRQGNIFPQVGISYYTQPGTLDAFFWQTLERKSRTIENFFSGNLQDRGMEDMGMGPITASQAKSAASKDPAMFRYSEVQRSYEELAQAKSQIERSATAARRAIPGAQQALQEAKTKLAVMEDKESEYSAKDIEIDGVKGMESGAIAKMIRELPAMKEGSTRKIGEINGRPLMIRWTMGSSAQLSVQNGGAKMSSADFTQGTVDGHGLNKALNQISPSVRAGAVQSSIAKGEQDLQNLQSKSEKIFKDGEKLAALDSELKDLTARLSKEGVGPSVTSENGMSNEIIQPDDGVILSDLQNADFKGIRKKTKLGDGRNARRVVEVQRIPQDTPAAEIVGVAKKTGADEGVVFIRAASTVVKIPQSIFLSMAKGDTAWSLDPNGDLYSENANGDLSSFKAERVKDLDQLGYIRRLDRMPENAPTSQDLFELEITQEKLAKAAEVVKDYNRGRHQFEDFQVGLQMVKSAASFSKEMGAIAESGVEPTIEQINAFAAKAEKASTSVQAAISLMRPALELIAVAQATKILIDGYTSDKSFTQVRTNDLYSMRGWPFQQSVKEIVQKAMPSSYGNDNDILNYFAWKFEKSKGMKLIDASLDDIKSFAENRVTFNANHFPGWVWAALGGAAAIAAGPMNMFGDVGAFDAIAVGLAASQVLRGLRWTWNKLTPINSPRTQMLMAHSRSQWGADYIIEMLDQALLRGMEIRGPAMAKIRALRKMHFTFMGKEKTPGLGREISNRISGRGRGVVQGLSEDEVAQATAVVESIFTYFRKLMDNLGMPTKENYVPIVYHHEGLKEAMDDPVAKDKLVSDIAEKVFRLMPDAVTAEMETEKESERDWNEDRRRRQASVRVAESIIEKISGEGFDDKYGVFREYTKGARPSYTKKRSLPFEIMEEVEGSDGRMIPLVDRNVFNILSNYIPKMSRAISHREVVNTHRINQWLDGLEPPPSASKEEREDPARYRARMFNYVQNDLGQSLSRTLSDGVARWARKIRVINTTRFLGLSAWYMMRNLMFGTPLAFGLTGFRGGASYAGRSIAALFGKGKEDAAIAGAISEGIFHDVASQDGTPTNRIFDLVNSPAAWSQEAVDVGGFYAGRAAAPKVLSQAKKGDARSMRFLVQGLGRDGAQQAVARGILTNEELNRMGLMFKVKISGSARSLNLPSFMGTDLGRTVFQFGSIPMEQTKTLMEDIFDGDRFMLNAQTGKFAFGGMLAGSVMIAKLWIIDALSQAALGTPENDRKKWLKRHSMFETAIYAMMESGAFQMLQPVFDPIDKYGRNIGGGIDNYLPMPTSSVASFGVATGQGIKRIGQTNGGNILEKTAFVLTPAVRDLVNRQTSLFRGFGIKIPNRTRLEKRIEKKD